jgi:hemoglobin
MPPLYDFAGGEEALHRLEDAFYTSVLKDPLLQPLFGAGQPQHVDHLTAFTSNPSAVQIDSLGSLGSPI